MTIGRHQEEFLWFSLVLLRVAPLLSMFVVLETNGSQVIEIRFPRSHEALRRPAAIDEFAAILSQRRGRVSIRYRRRTVHTSPPSPSLRYPTGKHALPYFFLSFLLSAPLSTAAIAVSRISTNSCSQFFSTRGSDEAKYCWGLSISPFASFSPSHLAITEMAGL